MGLYGTLVNASITCPRCGVNITDDWQFNWGTRTDLPEYHLGDDIHWEHNVDGHRTNDVVKAISYPVRGCTNCGNEKILGAIIIVNNHIERIEFYAESYHESAIAYIGHQLTPVYKK